MKHNVDALFYQVSSASGNEVRVTAITTIEDIAQERNEKDNLKMWNHPGVYLLPWKAPVDDQ